MRKVILQVHMTLDAYADGRERFVPEFDTAYWPELHAALQETGAAQVDTLLMGKGTYRQFARYWPKVPRDPSAPEGARLEARLLNETPKVVFSSSLTKAKWQPTTIVTGELRPEIERLRALPGQNLLVPGGVAFPRALIQQDLVDEYLLSVVPKIQGEGRHRLFGELAQPRNLKHLRTWTFSNGALLHWYERVPGPSTAVPQSNLSVEDAATEPSLLLGDGGPHPVG